MTQIKKNFSFLVLLFFFLVFLLVIKDFGIHVDDIDQARYGEVVLQHLIDPGNQVYLKSRQINYSPSYEVFLSLITSLFTGITVLEKYYIRHIVIFLTYALGVFCFTLTLKRLFRDERLVAAGTGFLFLFPPLLGFSAITTKEIPLTAFTMVAVYFLIKYMQEHHLGDLVLHIIFLAFASMVRLSGLGYLALTFYVILIVNLNSGKVVRSLIFSTIFSILAFALFIGIVIGLDPLTWSNPFQVLKSRMHLITDFDNGGALFYNGSVIRLNTAKAYMNLMFGARKMPDLVLFLAFLSIFVFIYQFFKQKSGHFFTRLKETPLIVVFLWFFIPLIAILYRNSVTYSIRHLLIFIPPLVIMATIGVQFLFKITKNNRWANLILVTLLAANFIYLAYENITLHPYQVSYFNLWSGGITKNQFIFRTEPDSLTFNEAALWLCQNKTDLRYSGPFINIYVGVYCPENEHLVYVKDYEEADILVTYYYYAKIKPVPPGFSRLTSIDRHGVPLLTIYHKTE